MMEKEAAGLYNLAKYLHHLPGRMFGQGLYGSWGAGRGAQMLGRMLGAEGQWAANGTLRTLPDGKTILTAAGKPEWHATGVRPGMTGFTYFKNKLAELGEKGMAAGRRSEALGNEAADAIAGNLRGADGKIDWRHLPKWLAGKTLRHTGGVITGGVALGTLPVGAAALTGQDSALTKGTEAVANAASVPFRYMNPIGLGMTALDYGARKFKGAAMDQAEFAASETAKAIADALRNQSRLNYAGGVLSPTKFGDAVETEALAQVGDKFNQLRKQYGL